VRGFRTGVARRLRFRSRWWQAPRHLVAARIPLDPGEAPLFTCRPGAAAPPTFKSPVSEAFRGLADRGAWVDSLASGRKLTGQGRGSCTTTRCT